MLLSATRSRAAAPPAHQHPALAGASPPRLILVTSAVPAEGKSTVVRNLAITFREAGAKVAVVDADLRRPTLAEPLPAQQLARPDRCPRGGRRPRGRAVSVPVRAHGLQTLARLSSGGGTRHAVDSDGEFLTCCLRPDAGRSRDRPCVRAPADILDRLLADHDIVLLDTAPILNVADTISLTHSGRRHDPRGSSRTGHPRQRAPPQGDTGPAVRCLADRRRRQRRAQSGRLGVRLQRGKRS